MPRYADAPLRKIHVRIYEADYQAIKTELSTDEAGINAIVRAIVHRFCLEAGDAMRRAIDRLEGQASGQTHHPSSTETHHADAND